MIVTARKYNPGFLTDDELVASFCVRTQEFASMVEALRDSSGSANTHQIVIGPRGSGKTSLLLRVAAEIRRDTGLSARFFPVVFAEESYEVSTAGEFWLECLSRLADQAPPEDDGPDLRRTHEDLRRIEDDRMLGDRCLGVLQDFADRQRKRLVLVVENLNMMFGDIGDPETGWQLRHTLQTDPRFLLLASATSRFDEIDKRGRAFYDLFRQQTLRPLDTEDCAALWRAVSGQDRAVRTIQALRILTGGSPRLLTIVARFGGELSFRELMADLLDLVDDHTEYFKSHLDALPAQERRVYLALAELWKPATTREIAERARLDTSKCSAHLARLTERGAVEVTGGSPRRKLYYLAERLYNIYYLMRRARGPAPIIEALIRFMEGWYSADELKAFGIRLAREAVGFDSVTLSLGRTAFERLLELPSLAPHREELLSIAPATLADMTGGLSDISEKPLSAIDLAWKANALMERGRLQEALSAWDDLAQHCASSDATQEREFVAVALYKKGLTLSRMNNKGEGIAVWDEVVRRFGNSVAPVAQEVVAVSLASMGTAFAQLNRLEEALDAYSEVFRKYRLSSRQTLQDAVSTALLGKSSVLAALNRLEDALAVCDEVLQRNQNETALESMEAVATALVIKSSVLEGLDRFESASAVWNQTVKKFGGSDEPMLLQVAESALLRQAEFDLKKGRSAVAIKKVNRVLERENPLFEEKEWLGRLVRACAKLEQGNVAACARDVETLLTIFAKLESLPKVALDGLSGLAVNLGPEKMRDLIVASPATDLLLPLTTALELELGEEPRVAKEVEEVAEDIRRDMAERRKAKSA